MHHRRVSARGVVAVDPRGRRGRRRVRAGAAVAVADLSEELPERGVAVRHRVRAATRTSRRARANAECRRVELVRCK
eukprot:31442-Pelagococcus_subviridis.AAC.7